MKKLSKIFLAIALVLVLAVPFVLAGCDSKTEVEEGIKIHTNFKTAYELNEDLDVTNGKLVYTDAEGKETVVAITADMITSFNTATVGTRQMVVTYQGFTTLVDYEVYKVVDIQVGDLFYATPSSFNPGYSDYDYVKFLNNSKVVVCSSNVGPAIINFDDEREIMSYTKTIENRHAIYTVIFANPYGTNDSVVITVVNENTISATITNGEFGQTYTGQLTKYVG